MVTHGTGKHSASVLKMQLNTIFYGSRGWALLQQCGLNGIEVGYHAGGRTTFTLDVTSAIRQGSNSLCVRADHPAFIKDLPWVCGGCSDDPGFSEGSQPMGIFRPVHLIVTNPVRIEPFGVHIWNDTTVSEKSATLNLETEIKNYGLKPCTVTVVNELDDDKGNLLTSVNSQLSVGAQTTHINRQVMPAIGDVHLWSLEKPYLYTVKTRPHYWRESNG